MSVNAAENGIEIKFTDREVSAWDGMALLKRMLDQMGFRQAASGWDLPTPGSNRRYPPVQLIERRARAVTDDCFYMKSLVIESGRFITC
jgi:hypothetical protein